MTDTNVSGFIASLMAILSACPNVTHQQCLFLASADGLVRELYIFQSEGDAVLKRDILLSGSPFS